MASLALDVDKLNKAYTNGVVALKDLSFQVKQGDFFALLGPNGAGKSTTIGILTSLVEKTGGQVRVFGYDIDRDFPRAKACVGSVPQEFNAGIFETPWQTLVYQAGYYGVPKKIAAERAEHFLQQLELLDKKDQLNRYLSGGMKRRLMIARGLMHHPKLLILDEPTAGVDINIRHSIWDFLKSINAQGTTIILTTHYLEEAEHLCKHIAIINQGSIVEQTSVKAFIEQLKIETFVFDLEHPLADQPDLGDFQFKCVDPQCLEIEIAKGQSLNDLFSLLSSYGIKVNSMRSKANRLETLFLRLTHSDSKGKT